MPRREFFTENSRRMHVEYGGSLILDEETEISNGEHILR